MVGDGAVGRESHEYPPSESLTGELSFIYSSVSKRLNQSGRLSCDTGALNSQATRTA